MLRLNRGILPAILMLLKSIQIQPMLRLNPEALTLRRWLRFIQIQPMLRLNKFLTKTLEGRQKIQIQPMLRLNFSRSEIFSLKKSPFKYNQC